MADEFATAARLYAESVVEYTQSARVSQAEYQRMRHHAEEKERCMEACRMAFEDHVSLHQCHESDPVPKATKLLA